MKSSYFIDRAKEQEKWRLKDAINLLPSENVTSPEVRALLSSDFGHRYTLPVNANWRGEFLENSYRGTRITDDIESKAEKITCEVFKSKYACVQPLSGHIAAMIAIISTTGKGDSICSVHVDNGGYDGYAQNYIPDIYGLTAWHLPFSKKRHNVNSTNAAEMILKKKPKVVVLGASFILFPYEIGPIRDACNKTNSTLIYDGSHVLGLITGGEFQRPLEEDVDLLYGSTHKSFFGPQGGLIVTNNEEINAAIRKNLTWRIMDNAHWNRIAALGHAMLEMKRFGRPYARRVIDNAQLLGKELSNGGFPIGFKEFGFTKSHQLIIDGNRLKRKFGLNLNDFSVVLEKSNINVDSVGRLGTGEITRMKIGKNDVRELAELIIKAIKGINVTRDVKRIRSHLKISFRINNH